MENGNFTNFENSYKIDGNSYNDNFFAVVIRRKMKFILAKKLFKDASQYSRTLIRDASLHLSQPP